MNLHDENLFDNLQVASNNLLKPLVQFDGTSGQEPGISLDLGSKLIQPDSYHFPATARQFHAREIRNRNLTEIEPIRLNVLASWFNRDSYWYVRDCSSGCTSTVQ